MMPAATNPDAKVLGHRWLAYPLLLAAAVDGDATIYLEPNLRASQFCRLEIVLDWTFWKLEISL